MAGPTNHTAQEVRGMLQGLAAALDDALPDGALFTLLVWTDDIEGHGSHYVSNADRGDVVRAMRETADRIDGARPEPSPN